MAAKGNEVDVAIAGAGIVGATLAALLSELQEGLEIRVFERLGEVAAESSRAMNNAGTGHAANCELNYTPQRPDGSVDITKALAINASFEVSLQVWSHLVEQGRIPSPTTFLTPCPHLSFVRGEADVAFLRARQAALRTHPMFQGMRITEDRAELAEWAPLIMEGREPGEPLAATRVDRGTDLDFGSLAQALFNALGSQGTFALHTAHEVRGLRRTGDGRWRVTVRDTREGRTTEVVARFVFLGAGGGALPLLLRSGIAEGRGYGGFPVSGLWLVCHNPEVVARHAAKVYGKASLGAPPMSVPHLDTRVIGGRKGLLFGPFAGFSTKFLKAGSYLDLPRSVGFGNLRSILMAGWHNLDLTRYLVDQVLQSPRARLRTLQTFYPAARAEDWDLAVAGQRVQIIKRDPLQGGKLEFGTEMVTSADGTLAALLGASPGASTCAATLVDLLQKGFGAAASGARQERLRRMVPSLGHNLAAEPDLLRTIRTRTDAVMGLR